MTYAHSSQDASERPREAVRTLTLPDRRHELLALEAYQTLRAIALGEVTGEAAQDLALTTAARLDLLGGAR